MGCKNFSATRVDGAGRVLRESQELETRALLAGSFPAHLVLPDFPLSGVTRLSPRWVLTLNVFLLPCLKQLPANFYLHLLSRNCKRNLIGWWRSNAPPSLGQMLPFSRSSWGLGELWDRGSWTASFRDFEWSRFKFKLREPMVMLYHGSLWTNR